jgi:hypothetical protein
MYTTLEIWNTVVAKTQELVPDFKTVKPYPLNRLLDGAFFKDLPGLQRPACLIVFRDDEQAGKLPDRNMAMSAVVVVQDADGQGYIRACTYLDALRAGFVNATLAPNLWCDHKSRAVFIDSGDKNLVVELQLGLRNF